MERDNHDTYPKCRSRAGHVSFDLRKKIFRKFQADVCHRWWLNLACLRRDGVINSSREIVTIRPGAIILPLLSGTEYPGREPRTYIYKKEGQVRSLHVALMAPGGRKVKVFRGHTLKSKFAPAAGIRYDGEYVPLVQEYLVQVYES